VDWESRHYTEQILREATIIKGRNIFIVILLLVIVLLGVRFLMNPDRRAWSQSFTERNAVTRELANYLVTSEAGTSVLIIGNPFTQFPDQPEAISNYEKAGISGLKKGFGRSIKIEAVVYPELKPEARTNPWAIKRDNRTTTPLSYLIATTAFDDLAIAHPNCDLIVSLIGLPADIQDVNFLRHENGPKLALLLPDLWMIGDTEAIRTAFTAGHIAAAVVKRPHANVSDDGQKNFDQVYILLTGENIDEFIEEYPSLF